MIQETGAILKMADAINEVLESDNSVLLVRGGQAAGKTFGMICLAVDYCYDNPNAIVYFIVFSYQQARLSLMKDIVNVFEMAEIPYWCNGYKTEFRFDNGSRIFVAVPSSPDFFKGFHAIDNGFTVIDEINKIPQEQVTQIFARSNLSIGLYNPTPCEWLKHVPNSKEIVLTYRDNEYIPVQERRNIEAYEKLRFDDNGNTVPYYERLYKIYNLGEFAESMLQVFTNVKIEHNFENYNPQIFGLDYSNSGGSIDGSFASGDPDTLVSIQVIGRDIYVRSHFKTNSLTLSGMASKIKIHNPRNLPVMADSANQRNTRELRGYGLNVTGVNKSVPITQQIRILNEYTIHIEESDKILLEEFKQYCWEDSTAEKIDKNSIHPDAIDAFRYACQGIIINLTNRITTTIA